MRSMGWRLERVAFLAVRLDIVLRGQRMRPKSQFRATHPIPDRMRNGNRPRPARALGLATCLLASACTSTPPADPIERELALETFDKAWSTIDETHYDPEFNGVDWAALREELRPRAMEAATHDELRSVLGEMLGRLNQSHFSVIPASALPAMQGVTAKTGEGGGKLSDAGDCGFDSRLREGELVVTRVDADGPAHLAGIRPGWVITHLGDLDIDEMVADMRSAKDALSERDIAFRAWRNAQRVAVGGVGTELEVSLHDRDDEARSFTLKRQVRRAEEHSMGNLPTFYLRFWSERIEAGQQEIGLVGFSNWFLPMMQPLNEALESMRACEGIVIDLRGNSGGAGMMTMGLAGHFFEERVLLGTQRVRNGEMKFVAIPRQIDSQGELLMHYAGPVAILSDEGTGSASEVFAGGMQSIGRARVFGETSAGAVLPATITELPNGDAMLHAFGDFKTATGELVEGTGVVPDEFARLTREALIEGRDPALDAAIAWIQSNPQS